MTYAGLLPLLLLMPTQAAERAPAEILREIRALGNQVPNAVFGELAQQKTPDALDALIKGLTAISRVEKLCAAYSAFEHFGEVPEVADDAAEYLEKCARQDKERLALHAVYRLGTLWPASQEELVTLALDHATPDGRSVALMHLVENGMPLSRKELTKLARSKDFETRYEALLAQTARIEDVAKRTRKIAQFARSRHAVERLVVTELLALADIPRRFEILDEQLADVDPRVARKAIASLERTRDVAAVEILIARLSVAREGERQRISRSLERLTGRSLGSEPGRWQRWWEKEGASFEISDATSSGEERPAQGLTSSSFYGLPIHADSLVFAIDTSDSMKQPAGGAGGESRIEVAKRELTKALESLPADKSIELVNFGSHAWSWKGELVAAKAKNKQSAIRHVASLDLTWGTEIYAALREAFRDPGADTILFLTDGDPQLSLMQDRSALRRIVAQWNRTRHTTIDCITIGTDRAWLRKLAEQTDGRYRRID